MPWKVPFLSCLALYFSANAAALPFTYDFGYIGSEDGFSGAGSFTISTSENLTADTTGLEAFEFTGLCAGYACSFDLADVTTAGSAIWSVDDTTGEIARLAIDAYGYLSGVGADTRLLVGAYDEIFLQCWDKSDRQSQVCNGDFYDYRAERYPGPETYITLREAAPVPIPATVWLIGAALIGASLARRKQA
ncbi:MAG: VPLPA-CTERM sorting domain-containing protein [Halioglobus sp.]|nr:VPLPA-CTERM sorting domain-containing protein [Halioglobus sp.]